MVSGYILLLEIVMPCESENQYYSNVTFSRQGWSDFAVSLDLRDAPRLLGLWKIIVILVIMNNSAICCTRLQAAAGSTGFDDVSPDPQKTGIKKISSSHARILNSCNDSGLRTWQRRFGRWY